MGPVQNENAGPLIETIAINQALLFSVLHRPRAHEAGLAPNGSRYGPAPPCGSVRLQESCPGDRDILLLLSTCSAHRFLRLSVLIPRKQGSYIIVTHIYSTQTICIIVLTSFSPRGASELAPWVKMDHSLSRYDGCLWPPHPERLTMAPIFCSAISPSGSPPESHNLPKEPLCIHSP